MYGPGENAVVRSESFVTKRATLLWLLTAASIWAQQGVIQVNVDARDAPRRLIHVQLHIPTSPGPVTLLYPQWIQGEHGPTGPIADIVSLKFRANNKNVFSTTLASLKAKAVQLQSAAASGKLWVGAMQLEPVVFWMFALAFLVKSPARMPRKLAIVITATSRWATWESS